jgi:hypothetical protein
MGMNKQERALRLEIIRKALTTDAAIAAVVELVEADLADDDINDDEAHERVHEAVRGLVGVLGYGADDE